MSSITSVTSRQQSQVRAWLRKHGKTSYIGFDDADRRELREFFNTLDDSQRGSIGYKELEEPLLALGLAETRQQVKEMVDVVDRDGSGQIEFEEFLSILKDSNGNEHLMKFFRSLIDGSLIKESKNMPLKLKINTYRRRMMLAAMMSKDQDNREKGERIMKTFARQVAHGRKEPQGEALSLDTRNGIPMFPRIMGERGFSPEAARDMSQSLH